MGEEAMKKLTTFFFLSLPAWATSNLNFKEVAQEAVRIELSGWRLVDPPKKCLNQKDYKFFAAVSQGNTEKPDGKVTRVSPKQAKNLKIISVTQDKEDSSVHHVVFKVGSIQDKLAFVVNSATSNKKFPVSFAKTSKHVFINQDCLK